MNIIIIVFIYNIFDKVYSKQKYSFQTTSPRTLSKVYIWEFVIISLEF
jgi:hypothetical protein